MHIINFVLFSIYLNGFRIQVIKYNYIILIIVHFLWTPTRICFFFFLFTCLDYIIRAFERIKVCYSARGVRMQCWFVDKVSYNIIIIPSCANKTLVLRAGNRILQWFTRLWFDRQLQPIRPFCVHTARTILIVTTTVTRARDDDFQRTALHDNICR